MATKDPYLTSEAAVTFDKAEGMILTIAEELKVLPGDVAIKLPPEEKKIKIQPERSRTQWVWISRMLPLAVGRWFIVQKNMGNKQAEYAIRDGRNKYIDPKRFEVRAVRTQSAPRLYDVYLRLRKPSEMHTAWEAEEMREWIRKARADWKDRYAQGWKQQQLVDKASAELRKIEARRAELLETVSGA